MLCNYSKTKVFATLVVHPTNGKLSYWYDQCEGFTSQLCKFKEHNILARPMMQWKDIYVGEMWMLDLRSLSIHLDKLGASDRQTQALNLFHLLSNYVDGSIKKKKTALINESAERVYFKLGTGQITLCRVGNGNKISNFTFLCTYRLS